MKILLDTCVWGGARYAAQAAGHDAVWCGDWEKDPGDVEILASARAEGRVLVTLDKDFGELAILKGQLHAGIIRLVGIPAREQGPATVQVLSMHADELLRGAIIVVEPDRIRVRLASS